jgi:hypothetical protein
VISSRSQQQTSRRPSSSREGNGLEAPTVLLSFRLLPSLYRFSDVRWRGGARSYETGHCRSRQIAARAATQPQPTFTAKPSKGRESRSVEGTCAGPTQPCPRARLKRTRRHRPRGLQIFQENATPCPTPRADPRLLRKKRIKRRNPRTRQPQRAAGVRNKRKKGFILRSDGTDAEGQR